MVKHNLQPTITRVNKPPRAIFIERNTKSSGAEIKSIKNKGLFFKISLIQCTLFTAAILGS
jgi:hypothetical protein